MKLPTTRKSPQIPLGMVELPLWRKLYALPKEELLAHLHVIGISGSGKSRFLAGLFLTLLNRGMPATLIDPHGELARLVLRHLVAEGAARRPDFFERVVYLDLPTAERAGRFLPFNVLAQRGSPSIVVSNVLEAMHRAWPALGDGAAPRFDKLIQNGVKVLVSNGLPLPALLVFLTNTAYRQQLLAQEPDADVVAFFRDQYDRLSDRDRLEYADSTLSRISLLTFSPILKFSLGQPELAIDFRTVMDTNRSLISNLAIADKQARPLLGCLLTVMAEHGALSRLDGLSPQPLSSHHLILDEAFEHTAQTETSLSRMLSQTRKVGLFSALAHQTWNQASDRLRGAMQNVGLEVVFQLGREDAVHSAPMLGRADPHAIKHEVSDDAAAGRSHPVFYSLPEQWETWVQAIQDLRPREAFIKRRSKPTAKIRTLSVPDPTIDDHELRAVEQTYLARYFRAPADDERTLGPRGPMTPLPTTRMRDLSEE